MIQDPGTGSTDLRGLARLAVEAAVGVTDLVEAVHHTIRHPVAARLGFRPIRGRGLKGWVYASIRTLAGTLGAGVDAALSLMPALGSAKVAPDARSALVAALNGVMGDHLAATGNPLALEMTLQHEGRTLRLETAALAAAVPEPRNRLLLLVHGLCVDDRHWARAAQGQDADLAAGLGCTLLHLRYNSGLHVSTNGRALADLLEQLLAQWPVPVEHLAILGHSMGGLLARSACHQAAVSGQAWPGSLRHLVFLGTPHHGAPLERWGHLLERILAATPYANPFTRLGRLRSAGITDLRHGNLLDQDWQGREAFRHHRDTRRPVPLPEGVCCFAIAALAGGPRGPRRLRGDGLVPVASALGLHPEPRRCLAFPESRTWLGHGMGHMDLLARPEVYAQIGRWLGSPPSGQGDP